MASAAAPTYFLPARIDKTYYVDGGLCCNNPAFRAVSVLYRENVELRKIYVLSISTGAVPVTRAGKKFLRLHKLKWIRPIIDLAMTGRAISPVRTNTWSAITAGSLKPSSLRSLSTTIDARRRCCRLWPTKRPTRFETKSCIGSRDPPERAMTSPAYGRRPSPGTKTRAIPTRSR